MLLYKVGLSHDISKEFFNFNLRSVSFLKRIRILPNFGDLCVLTNVLLKQYHCNTKMFRSCIKNNDKGNLSI